MLWRSLRECSLASPREEEVLFCKDSELGTAYCPFFMLVNCPAWLSEAMPMPYAHATEAFYFLRRGTLHKAEHTVFIAGWLSMLPEASPGFKEKIPGKCGKESSKGNDF